VGGKQASCPDSFFSDDYSTARRRFRSACEKQGVTSTAYLHQHRGPTGEELATDVARWGAEDAQHVIVLSSALHGVEGFFGSAVQLAVIEAIEAFKIALPNVAVVMIHTLNPWGFAWLRRTDAQNIDSNRNFLLADETYQNCSDGYRRLNGLLNPAHPPRRCDLFTVRAAWQVIRHGMPAVKQAVAGGQYELAQGLFYGGSGPGAVQQMLAEHLATWIGPARRVVHLDFHTGLGPWATYRLLFDYFPSSIEQQQLAEMFGAERLGDMDPHDVAYAARGGLGRWCRAHLPNIDYVELCAEFGTYAPLTVLKALRAENQAHHWSAHPPNRDHRAKRKLLEAFCPASDAWRERCVQQAVDLVAQTARSIC
jgi:hypothetical protein